MNQNMLVFIQMQTLPLNMRHKWKENIDIVYKTTNEKPFGKGDPTTDQKSSQVERRFLNGNWTTDHSIRKMGTLHFHPVV